MCSSAPSGRRLVTLFTEVRAVDCVTVSLLSSSRFSEQYRHSSDVRIYRRNEINAALPEFLGAKLNRVGYKTPPCVVEVLTTKPLDNAKLVGWDLESKLLIDVQVGLEHLAWNASEPLIQ